LQSRILYSNIVFDATVVKDVPAKKVVIGIPAKEVKDVPEDQLLVNQK